MGFPEPGKRKKPPGKAGIAIYFSTNATKKDADVPYSLRKAQGEREPIEPTAGSIPPEEFGESAEAQQGGVHGQRSPELHHRGQQPQARRNFLRSPAQRLSQLLVGLIRKTLVLV